MLLAELQKICGCCGDDCADCSCIKFSTGSACGNLVWFNAFMSYGLHPVGAPGPSGSDCYWGVSLPFTGHPDGLAVIYDDGLGNWIFYIQDYAGHWLQWTQPQGISGPCPDFTGANWTLSGWSAGCNVGATLALDVCAAENCPTANTCAGPGSYTVTATGATGACAGMNGVYTVTPRVLPIPANNCEYNNFNPMVGSTCVIKCQILGTRRAWTAQILGETFGVYTLAALPPLGVWPLIQPQSCGGVVGVVTIS